MIAGLLSLLGSSFMGTILGGIFAFLNKKSDLQAKQMDLEHERAKWANDLVMRDKDISYAQIEAQGKLQVAVVEGDATTEAARFATIAASQTADVITADEIKEAGKWGWLLVVGAAMRSWIRPVATVILVGSATYLNWLLIDQLTHGWSSMTADRQYEMGVQAFAWITGQASAVLSYWFVSRKASG